MLLIVSFLVHSGLLGILFISSLVCPPFSIPLSLSLFLSFSFSTHSFLLSSLDLLSFIPLVDCILPLSFVVVVQSFAITVLS